MGGVFDRLVEKFDADREARATTARSRLVARLKRNTPFSVVEEREVAPRGPLLSDRIGHLPHRVAASRQNPTSKWVREIRLVNDSGKILRIFTNDLDADAQDIADLYKRRWAIELFFRWGKQTVEIKHFLRTSENAARIRIAVALIALMLPRLAHEANKIVESPLKFARLVCANLMHRRQIVDLLRPLPLEASPQYKFDFGRGSRTPDERTRRNTLPNAQVAAPC